MLYKHQQALLERNPAKRLLCWDTGTGKSLASIEWAKKKGGKTLFIVPKALSEKWVRDIFKEGYKDGWVLTKEGFRKRHKQIEKYDNVVVDEAHYFSGIGSLMTKSLFYYLKAHSIQNVLLLTATPYLSTPWNIYTLARHLGHQWSYIEFKQKFFDDRYIGRRVVPEVKKGIEKEIAGLVAYIGDVVRLDECVDVPDQIFESESISMTVEQLNFKKNIIDTNAVVRYTKYHELENGVLKGDGYDADKVFECDKNERIIQLARENKKLVVVCRYNLQIDAISNLLSKEGFKNIKIIRGETRDRDSVVRQVEAMDSAIVLINASCSEGYELPSFGVVVFASLSFSYKDYKQMCGRFLRINRLKKNVYIHLVMSGGIDQEVYNAIMSKQDFNIEIYSQNHE